MGALDVCPFIPVRGVSMDQCVLCAQAFGQRLAEELGVPGECPLKADAVPPPPSRRDGLGGAQPQGGRGWGVPTAPAAPPGSFHVGGDPQKRVLRTGVGRRHGARGVG